MPALNLDRWLARRDTSGKGGREGGLRTRKHGKSFRIVRARLDVDFEVYPRDCTSDTEENHHVLEVFVVLSDITQLKRICLVLY